MTPSPQPESPEPLKVAKKIEPGSELHFALLGVPMGWNFLTGKDYADMQAFAKAVWDAATGTGSKQASAEGAMPEPFGYVLHWPKIGGGVTLLFDESRVSGDAIGCKVAPVYEEAAIHAARNEAEAMRADAERYRWLREQEWFESNLCVLRDPKRVLTQGIGLGADCPSGNRLDSAIDTARALVELGERS